MTSRRGFLGGASAAAVLAGSRAAFAQKKYDDGATDKDIKIGHFCPYSGPASAYGVIGQAHQVFWKMVNDTGGINGRKVVFVTMDDGYSPPKSVEVARQMVEQDKVLCLFNTLGTATNTAIHKYMNQKKVPQLLVSTGVRATSSSGVSLPSLLVSRLWKRASWPAFHSARSTAPSLLVS